MIKIVIADDESPIREWLNYCLQGKGESFKIVGTASDGMQTYNLILKEKPDVVIIDINMPIMDGISVMEKIKKILPETEFVILTNCAEFSYAKKAITYGAKEYILKSELRSSELINLIQEIDDNHHLKSDEKRLYNQFNQKDKDEIASYQDNFTVNKKSIEKGLDYIHLHYSESISLTDVAKQLYRSPEYFSRLFKEVTGQNFSIYLIHYRLNQAKNMLLNTELKITDISYRVGYHNPSYFSRLYKKYMGITPEDERRKSRFASK